VDNWPPIRCWIANSDRILDLQDWPPPQAKKTKFFLSSKGLSRQAPEGEEGESTFTYNPADPVPTKGGCNLTIISGRHDHSELLDRKDILVFDTDALEEDLTVAGRVKAHLFVKTSAADTDFTVMLLDVYPKEGDKRPYRGNVCDSILRLRFRNGIGKEDFVKPGGIVEIVVDLWSTAYRFEAGHRLGVHISSSNFPRFDRNLNTREKCGCGTKAVKAQNTVLYGGAHASYLELYTLD